MNIKENIIPRRVSESNKLKNNLLPNFIFFIYYMKLPSRIRYNASIQNSTSPGENIPVIHDVTQNRNIIKDCSKYYLSVERFQIPGYVIPLHKFRCTKDLGTGDWLTDNAFRVVAGASVGTSQCTYEFDTFDGNIPTKPGNVFDPKNPFFWVYSYSRYCTTINDGIKKAHDAAGLSSDPAPFLRYRNDIEKFQMMVPQVYIDNGYQLFANLKASTELPSLFNQYLNENYYGLCTPSSYDLPSETINGDNYRVLESEYKAYAYISTLRRLLIVTYNIPVTTELDQAGVEFEGQPNQNAKYSKILTDFQPLLDNPGDARTDLNFSRNGPIRVIDMNSETGLNRISIQVFWVDNFNAVIPLEIGFDQPVDIKLEFIRKDTFYG